MGRKYIPAFDKEMSKRLRSLIVDSRAIAEHLGCSTQAISQYRSGASRPSLENIAKIADFYNTTTDYILGLTWGAKSRNPDLQNVMDYTGLDESAAAKLHSCIDAFSRVGKSFISDFINSVWIWNIGKYLWDAGSLVEEANTSNYLTASTTDGRLLLDTADGLRFTRYQVESAINVAVKHILDSYYEPMFEQLGIKYGEDENKNAVNQEDGD